MNQHGGEHPESDTGSSDATGPSDTLDCLGQRCPLPVIALARRLPTLPVGAVLRVLADDVAANLDIPAWCRLRGQEYLGASTIGPAMPAGTPQPTAHNVRRVS